MRRRRIVLPALLAALTLAASAGASLAAEVTFRYEAPDAKQVFLAGSFNGWSDSSEPLSGPDADGVWELTRELPPGRHQYKYVVDGQWRPDPAAAETADDGFGGQNSVLVVEAADQQLVVGPAAGAEAPATAAPAPTAGEAGAAVAVTFGYRPEGRPGAVHLAGDFNGWNAEGDAMTDPDGDGLYTATVSLTPGAHQYKFVVDGQWRADPENPETAPDGYGGDNSVVTVPAGAAEYRVGSAAGGETVGEGPREEAPEAGGAPALPAAPGQVQVTFRYAPGGDVGDVYLAGEFNDWNAQGERMRDDDGDGVYTATIPLAPGKYQYKFVAGGQWQADPNNPATAPDGFGGDNSVVVVPSGIDQMEAAAGTAAEGEAGGGEAGGGAEGGGTAEGGGAPLGVGPRSVEFRYTPVISGVQNVFLAGTFNDWNDSQTRMTDPDQDGTYTATLLLEPGSYQYKFVVDGQWHQDPDNPAGAPDGFGGQNSVLTVDASFPGVDIELGDGRIYTDDIEPVFDYSTCNPVSDTEVIVTAPAHADDVEQVTLVYRIGDGSWQESPMAPAESDASFQYWRATVELPAGAGTEYAVRYRDAGTTAYLGPAGFSEQRPDPGFRYDPATHPPFATPAWARGAIVYQIFPERFGNGDPANDPDFSEPWYQGVTELPASGKTNGEYFHLVDDWYDVSGLTVSPYRTDGKPDYYSFYGGDIAGVRQKLDYLQDLGVEVIYFNPLNQGMSNHKYDPVDYLKIDPHFAGEQEFKDFVQDAHGHGIRIIVDMAFNHTGNWHFAFRDAVEKGQKSKYWNWYEFHRWPLPDTRDFDASAYYDCWWGFGLHPNLNYDLSRPNADENHVQDIADAEPNLPMVDYVLSVAPYWLGELDIDGFRLDVPNEVPFWFWKMFREAVDAAKPDAYLVGELWGNAGSWIGPECFDATMNYKYFRDPVMDFIGKGAIDAAAFDGRLGPGRYLYPPQAVAVMMNLCDSHDTIRFLTSTGDVRRLMLAALFGMTYPGMPHIWYGDEVGMQGGKDPDCRRPFDWRYEGDPRKVALHDYYARLGRQRRDDAVLKGGDFRTVLTDGQVYGFARTDGDRAAVTLINAGPEPRTVSLADPQAAGWLPEGAATSFLVLVGPERFPGASAGGPAEGSEVDLGGGGTEIVLPGLSGLLLRN